MAKWRDKISGTTETESDDDELHAVMLIRGARPDGEAQWAYVKMPVAHVPLFKAIESQGNYDLNDPDVLGPDGEILAHGLGKAPPEALTEELRQTYDLDMNTEETLIEAFESMLEEHDNTQKPD